MLIEQPDYPQLERIRVQGGYLEGTRTPQGFQTARLVSTDPSMYLRGEYAPGSFYRER